MPILMPSILFILSVRFYGDAELPKFVRRVESCPENLADLLSASSMMNCLDNISSPNPQRVYHCLPSSFLNETVEFCGPSKPNGGGYCPIYTYSPNQNTAPNFKKCTNFKSGCPQEFYQTKEAYKYPACQNINKEHRCFVADPSCKAESRDFIKNVTSPSREKEEPDEKEEGHNLPEKDNSLKTPSFRLGFYVLIALLAPIAIIFIIVLGAYVLKLHRTRHSTDQHKRKGKYNELRENQDSGEPEKGWPGYPRNLNEKDFKDYVTKLHSEGAWNLDINILTGKYNCDAFIALLKKVSNLKETYGYWRNTKINKYLNFSKLPVTSFTLEDTDIDLTTFNQKKCYVCAVNAMDLNEKTYKEIREELAPIDTTKTEYKDCKVFVLLMVDMKKKQHIGDFYNKPCTKEYCEQLANGIGMNMTGILPLPINSSDELSTNIITLINVWIIFKSVTEDD